MKNEPRSTRRPFSSGHSMRPVLICENHTRFIDARDRIEQPRQQKQFDAVPVVTSNPFWRER
jgi:hypothetical protein